MVVCEGATVMLLLEATNPTAQLALYHFQEPPAPRVPPILVSVTLSPWQMVDLLTVIEVAGLDVVLSLINLLTQGVVLQTPSALA